MRNRRICSRSLVSMRVRGWVCCVTVSKTFPLRPRMGLGSGRVSTGIRAKSWLMKLSPELESTKNGTETDYWPQRSMHGSVKQAGVEQEEEVLTNNPTPVPSSLGRAISEEVASLAAIQAEPRRQLAFPLHLGKSGSSHLHRFTGDVLLRWSWDRS